LPGAACTLLAREHGGSEVELAVRGRAHDGRAVAVLACQRALARSYRRSMISCSAYRGSGRPATTSSCSWRPQHDERPSEGLSDASTDRPAIPVRLTRDPGSLHVRGVRDASHGSHPPWGHEVRLGGRCPHAHGLRGRTGCSACSRYQCISCATEATTRP
jgi:hypothetical protein